jgi:hypothetical protein
MHQDLDRTLSRFIMVEKSNGLGGGTPDGVALRCSGWGCCSSSAGEGSSDLTAVFSSAAQTTQPCVSILSSENQAWQTKEACQLMNSLPWEAMATMTIRRAGVAVERSEWPTTSQKLPRCNFGAALCLYRNAWLGRPRFVHMGGWAKHGQKGHGWGRSPCNSV